MVTRVNNHPNHTSHYVFHHGLIKLLVITKLKKMDKSSQHFLFWFGFDPKSQMHTDDKEIEKKHKDSKRQKRKDEHGNEQSRKEFDGVNMSMSKVSRT